MLYKIVSIVFLSVYPCATQPRREKKNCNQQLKKRVLIFLIMLPSFSNSFIFKQNLSIFIFETALQKTQHLKNYIDALVFGSARV